MNNLIIFLDFHKLNRNLNCLIDIWIPRNPSKYLLILQVIDIQFSLFSEFYQ